MKVQVKYVEGKGFPYTDFGHETHGRTSFRLWLSYKLLTKVKDEGEETEHWEIDFPVQNARLHRTQKGNWVLRPEEGWVTFNLYCPEGYRGSGHIDVLRPSEYVSIPYYIYRSPRGSCGIGMGLIVSVPGSEVMYRWKRTGRLYGRPSQGITRVLADGTVEELDMVPDGLEAIEELKEAVGDEPTE